MVAQRRYRRNSAAKETSSNAKASAWESHSIVNSHHKAATGSRFEVLSGVEEVCSSGKEMYSS